MLLLINLAERKNNMEKELTVYDENVVASFESFDEVEEIVTATEKGTLVCCF